MRAMGWKILRSGRVVFEACAATFLRKRSLSTRRVSRLSTQRCVRAVYRRGAEKVELFAVSSTGKRARPQPEQRFQPVREVDECSRADWRIGVASVARERVISRERRCGKGRLPKFADEGRGPDTADCRTSALGRPIADVGRRYEDFATASQVYYEGTVTTLDMGRGNQVGGLLDFFHGLNAVGKSSYTLHTLFVRHARLAGPPNRRSQSCGLL
jgi:hypothetical protein